MKRGQRIVVSLNETELECLRKLARQAQLSPAGWVRTEIVAQFARQFPTLAAQRAAKLSPEKKDNDE